MGLVGREERGVSGLPNPLGPAMMYGFWREQADARVVVLLVVPVKEVEAEGPSVLDRSEPVWKLGLILEGLELALRKGIVIGHMRPPVRLRHPQIRQQEGHRLRGHRRAAIRMEGQLALGDGLFLAGLTDKSLSQRRGFAMGDHPADHIAAENIQDHIQVEIGPLSGPQQFGDIPGPHLVGSGGQKFGRLVRRVVQLVASLTDLHGRGQHAVHSAHRTQVSSFVKQGRIHLCWGLIPKPLGVEDSKDGLALRRTQRPHREWLGPRRRILGLTAPVPRGPRHPEGMTGSGGDDGRNTGRCSFAGMTARL